MKIWYNEFLAKFRELNKAKMSGVFYSSISDMTTNDIENFLVPMERTSGWVKVCHFGFDFVFDHGLKLDKCSRL